MTEKTKYKILVAEDDFLVCEEIKRSIKKIGYKIAGIASNGSQAIEMVKTHSPDIVLMDIQMPRMDGLAAAKEIQKTKSTPVIILTAHDSLEFIHKAGEYGVGAFLTKPPKAEEIERAVIIAIERHKDFLKLKHMNEELEKNLLQREKAEEQLKNLLTEKDLLLKEVHHRVKNNFMIISSLISLQTNHINDPDIRDMLQETHNRINSMSLIHEKLYQSENLEKIDFNAYISNLVKNLFHSYAIDTNQILVNLDIKDIQLNINRAIPIGLVVNELISNILKHAFPKDKLDKGTIYIKMSKHDNNLELIVQDNGIGLPDNFNINTSNSLGMRLITLLVNNQLGGSINFENPNGTKITISIPKI